VRLRVHGKLELPQQNASYHLKQLVDAGVIVRERRGGGDRDRRPERDGGAALP
jgi:DNA-binding transcriptional ArsR family regulator